MTNITKKGIWAIVLGTLAVAVFIFFAIATQGFVNWNGESWFDYWGKGKVVRVSEQPNTQMTIALTSANDGLYYDSDDTELIATVNKFSTPFMYTDSSYVYFLIYGSNGYTFSDPYKMQISVGDEEKDYDISYGVVTERGVYDGVRFTYENFVNEFNLTASDLDFNPYYPTVSVKVYACPNDDYLESDDMNKSVYVPPTDMLTVNKSISFEGTKLKVRLPYDYRYYNSTMAGTYKQLRISISSGNFSPTGPYNYTLNGTQGEHLYANYADDFATDTTNPFTLNTEVSGQHYYEVDLAKLDFVNELQANVGVRINCIWESSGGKPDIILHPFAHTSFYSYDTADFNFCVKKLDSPKNLAYKSGRLSWSAVDGALGYAVFDNGFYITSSTPDTSIDVSEVTPGEHTFRVRALGNVGKSLYETDTANVMSARSLNAYNASSSIVQLVLLTYEINGDTVTKFVPLGSTLTDYIYDIDIPNKEFLGWYYDNGYSRKVEKTDTISDDTVIYARLADIEVTERALSWWEENMWYVLTPIFVFVGITIIGVVVFVIRKKKAA